MASISQYWMAQLSGCGTWGSLLHPGLRGLPEVEEKFLEITSIHQFLELSPERTTIYDMIAHTVVESVVLFGSRSLRVGQELPQAFDDFLALDGVVHLVHGDFERSEVGFLPVNLSEFTSLLTTLTT